MDQGKLQQPPSSSSTELTPNSDAVARPIQAWPWFQTSFCEDPRYRPPNSSASVATVVPWHHFWAELGKLAFSEGLNELWWAFDDHKLAQPSQRQVFQDHLWGRVQPSPRDNITAAEFRAAVDVFSSDGGLADLIESIMRDTPGTCRDGTLHLRDQVFLSHTGADADKGSVSLTSAIYHKLRDKWQVMAFYDTHTLEPGDEWRAKIERCVRSSKVVVVVLSPSFFSRYWCMHELDLALNADPEPAKRTIIPVLLGVDHSCFHRNARAKYRQTWQAFQQLSGRSDVEQVLDRWESNLRQLGGRQGLDAAAYGMGVKKDWESMLVPEVASKVLQHVAACAGWQQDMLQPQQRQRHVHDLLPGHLVTNTAALQRLQGSIEAACSNQAAAMQHRGSSAAATSQSISSCRAVPPYVVQLLGMAGMGKSTLALQTAYHYQDTGGCFNGTVHFLRVPPKPAHTDDKDAVTAAVMQLQRDLLQQLQPGAADAAAHLTSTDQLHRALTNAFASVPLQRQTHLLVLDDVWHKDIVQHFRCSTMRGVILVTSRTSIQGSAAAGVADAVSSTLALQADADSREAARVLMMAVVRETHGELSADMQDVVDDVLSKCDGNLLATALMAGALTRRRTAAAWQMVCRRFMQRLQTESPIVSAIQAALDSLAAAAAMDQQAALQAFDMLRHLQCRLMLPLPLLQLLWEVLHPLEADEDVGMLMDHLLQASLVCRQQGDNGLSYHAHAVVDEVLAGQTPAASLPAAAVAVPDTSASHNKLAVLLLGFGRPHAVTWAQQLLGVQPLDGRALVYLGVLRDEVLQRPVTELVEEPAGMLYSVLGEVHRQDGQYGKAVEFFRRALAICEKVIGPKHPNTAASLNNVAGSLKAQGKLAEAEPLYRCALAIREEVLGPKHSDTATALNNLAGLLTAQGKLAEAEPLHRRALAICEEVLGPKHPYTVTALNNLATLLQEQGKLAEAAPVYRRAVAISEEVLGPKHPDTASSLSNQAWLVMAQGKLAEAEPLFRRALAIREEVLGLKHPDTAISFNNLAGLLQAQGKLAEAEPLYRRSLAISEEVLGPKHPYTATTLNNLAVLLQAQGKLAEAEPLYRHALAISKAVLGPKHPDTATSLNDLATLLQSQGKLSEAEPLYRRALAIRGEVLGPEHHGTAATLNNLAELLQHQGKLVEAEPLYRHALAIREEVLGPEHPNTASSVITLAGLLEAQGKLADAEPLNRRALAIYKEVLGPKHPGTATALNDLAGLLMAQGKLAEAEPLYRRAVAIREEVLGPKHPHTAIALNNLAGLLTAQGKLAEAEPLYRRALAINEAVLGRKHPDTAASLHNLARLLHDQGQLADVEPLYRRALAISEEVLGATHPMTTTSLNNLAGWLQAQGKLAEAEPLYRRVLAISEQVLGPKHPGTATALNTLATLLLAQSKLAEAEPLHERALAICEEVLGPKHPYTATALNNLAGLLQAQGKLAEAEPLHKRALAICEEVLGPKHPCTATALNNLAMLLKAQGKLSEAEPLYGHDSAIREEVFEPEHPHTISLRVALVDLVPTSLAEPQP